jgi:hypothetical protein
LRPAGFTPAFGRAVQAFGLTFYGTVETVPFRASTNRLHRSISLQKQFDDTHRLSAQPIGQRSKPRWKQTFQDDLSKSTQAVRRYSEGKPTGPPEDATE